MPDSPSLVAVNGKPSAISEDEEPKGLSDSPEKRKSGRGQPKTVFGSDQDGTVNSHSEDGGNCINKQLTVDINKNEEGQPSVILEEDFKNANVIGKFVVASRTAVLNFVSAHHAEATMVILLALGVAYFVYFGFAIHFGWRSTKSYCDGVKFLFILTVLVVSGLIYFQIIKRFFGKFLEKNCVEPLTRFVEDIWEYLAVRLLTYLVLIAAVVIYLVIDTSDDRKRLISVAGLFVYNLICYLISRHPERISWRPVFWGLGLQFILALLILKWPVGYGVFQCLGDKIQIFLNYTDAGSSFVFGYLVTGVLNPWTNVTIDIDGVYYRNESTVDLPLQDQLFGFKVLPVILYFSFFIAILYYYGVMQWVIQKLGWCLQVTIGTTACESVNTAACIFLGQSEAPLVIKPYINDMTRSELHAVMTAGFANVAGSTLAAYISFGIDPGHLLTASVMSAPAALGVSKLLYPEIEESRTKSDSLEMEKGEEKTVLEAAANGACLAIALVANVAANLIAFIAFIYFLDGVLSWMGGLVGWEFITFEWLLGQVFTPLAYLMGVDWVDCEQVGRLIGIKTIVNEFVAYSELAELMNSHAISDRSATIATYALCGFSNLSSMGIQLGILGGLAPERKKDLAEVVVTALVGGSAACFMTACVAGALID